MPLFQNFPDRFQKIMILLKCRKIRIVLYYLVGAAEKESRPARAYHAQVVVAVSGCDGIKADGLGSLTV